MYRQGDVLLIPVSGIPAGARAAQRDEIVLAIGESTGNSHRIAHPGAVLWLDGERVYIHLAEATHLVHQEHGAIALPPGSYEVRRQRVYTPEGVEWVRD